MRIKNLDIEGFRGFRRFRIKNLGRINLIVGTTIAVRQRSWKPSIF